MDSVERLGREPTIFEMVNYLSRDIRLRLRLKGAYTAMFGAELMATTIEMLSWARRGDYAIWYDVRDACAWWLIGEDRRMGGPRRRLQFD